MTLSITDSEQLRRIADALERQADAEEARNKMLERDIAERRKAVAEERERSERALAALTKGTATFAGSD